MTSSLYPAYVEFRHRSHKANRLIYHSVFLHNVYKLCSSDSMIFMLKQIASFTSWLWTLGTLVYSMELIINRCFAFDLIQHQEVAHVARSRIGLQRRPTKSCKHVVPSFEKLKDVGCYCNQLATQSNLKRCNHYLVSLIGLRHMWIIYVCIQEWTIDIPLDLDQVTFFTLESFLSLISFPDHVKVAGGPVETPKITGCRFPVFSSRIKGPYKSMWSIWRISM